MALALADEVKKKRKRKKTTEKPDEEYEESESTRNPKNSTKNHKNRGHVKVIVKNGQRAAEVESDEEKNSKSGNLVERNVKNKESSGSEEYESYEESSGESDEKTTIKPKKVKKKKAKHNREDQKVTPKTIVTNDGEKVQIIPSDHDDVLKTVPKMNNNRILNHRQNGNDLDENRAKKRPIVNANRDYENGMLNQNRNVIKNNQKSNFAQPNSPKLPVDFSNRKTDISLINDNNNNMNRMQQNQPLEVNAIVSDRQKFNRNSINNGNSKQYQYVLFIGNEYVFKGKQIFISPNGVANSPVMDKPKSNGMHDYLF